MGLSFLYRYAGRWSYAWSEIDECGNDRMVEMFSLHSIYFNVLSIIVSLRERERSF